MTKLISLRSLTKLIEIALSAGYCTCEKGEERREVREGEEAL